MSLYKNGIWTEGIVYEYTLPKEYTELKYLESDGSAYLNLNYFYGGESDKIEIKFAPMESGDLAVFGVYSGGVCELGYYNNKIRANVGSTSEGHSYTNGDIFIFKNINKYWYYNNYKYATISASNSSYSCLLFGRWYNGAATKISKSRIYYLKIERNNHLIYNLIPAKRNLDNVLGMYDIVSNTFFTNAGSGSFVTASDSIKSVSAKIYKENNKIEANSFIEI